MFKHLFILNSNLQKLQHFHFGTIVLVSLLLILGCISGNKTHPEEKIETKIVPSIKQETFVATFSAESEDRDKESNKHRKMYWIINRDTLRFDSKPISVIPNKNKLDTIYYKITEESKLDTLICNIAECKSYNFVYNPCCGGFNVVDVDKGKMIRESILMKISDYSNGKNFLGTLGEVGMRISDSFQDTLKENCRSAMSPNIYRVKLMEIQDCGESNNCEQLMCLHNPNVETDFEYDYMYTIASEKLSFLYLPLSTEPFLINYNLKKKKWTTKNY